MIQQSEIQKRTELVNEIIKALLDEEAAKLVPLRYHLDGLNETLQNNIAEFIRGETGIGELLMKQIVAQFELEIKDEKY